MRIYAAAAKRRQHVNFRKLQTLHFLIKQESKIDVTQPEPLLLQRVYIVRYKTRESRS